jgi:hypothetical protein
LAILRATVHRNKYSRGIQHHSFIELGTRISKQLYKLILGVGTFRQVEIAGEYEYNMAKAVMRSSVTTRLLDVVAYLYKSKINDTDGMNLYEAEDATGLPAETCRFVLDNLAMLGVLRRRKESGGTKIFWYLTADAKSLIEESEVLK